MSAEEIHIRILKLLTERPDITQRELSEALGVSLGKTHYLLRGLLDKGLVKMRNFRNSRNRAGYLYQLHLAFPRSIYDLWKALAKVPVVVNLREPQVLKWE